MPQPEDKLALERLNENIEDLELTIFTYENHLKLMRKRLVTFIDRKKSMENYLNSDKTLTEN